MNYNRYYNLNKGTFRIDRIILNRLLLLLILLIKLQKNILYNYTINMIIFILNTQTLPLAC